MVIPEKIKIGGKLYSVLIANLNKEIGNKEYGGQTSLFKHWIKIQCDMPESQKKETLLHEIIEIINGMNDLGLNHTQISILSNYIYQVYIDNFQNNE